jgi:hypothetical protein
VRRVSASISERRAASCRHRFEKPLQLILGEDIGSEGRRIALSLEARHG